MSLENDRRGVTPESIDPMTLFIIIEIFDFPPEKCQGVIFNQEKISLHSKVSSTIY